MKEVQTKLEMIEIIICVAVGIVMLGLGILFGILIRRSIAEKEKSRLPFCYRRAIGSLLRKGRNTPRHGRGSLGAEIRALSPVRLPK